MRLLAALLGLALAGCTSTAARAPAAAEPAAREALAPERIDGERRARARLDLANAYFERGQFDTALEEIRLVLAGKPDMAEAYALRGLTYAALGELGLAEDNLRQALRLNPQDGVTMNSLGWFYCQRERYAEAEALFQQALAQPLYRDARRTQHARGVCFSRAARWLEAEGALMRAYELDPANAEVGFNLAEVLVQRQDYERARFYIGRVNEIEGAANAQTLWLGVRIAHQLGDKPGRDRLGQQLRAKFPQSPQAQLFELGRFDG